MVSSSQAWDQYRLNSRFVVHPSQPRIPVVQRRSRLKSRNMSSPGSLLRNHTFELHNSPTRRSTYHRPKAQSSSTAKLATNQDEDVIVPCGPCYRMRGKRARHPKARSRRQIYHLRSRHQGTGKQLRRDMPCCPFNQHEQQFIPYGATLTNLFVNDKTGKEVDVVLGYDDVSYYR